MRTTSQRLRRCLIAHRPRCARHRQPWSSSSTTPTWSPGPKGPPWCVRGARLALPDRVYRSPCACSPTHTTPRTPPGRIRPGLEGAASSGRQRVLNLAYRIITNPCLKFLRDRPHTQPLPETHEAPAGRPDQVAEANARRHALHAAIAALRPEQRAALVLREFEGCTYEEVAAILAITVPAVKGRIHRARLELLDAMQPWT